MRFLDAKASADHWDAVVIGSGFGSLFFVRKYLEQRPKHRVLILERGGHHTLQWQAQNQRNSTIAAEQTFTNNSAKPWQFTVGLGGGTNCWGGMAPRLHPTDFDLKTRTGRGANWPLAYNDLIAFYREAEEIMLIAGPDDLDRHYPGTGKYPQPPHRMSTPERMLKEAYGDLHFPCPTAKLSIATNNRGRCCSTATCSFCPVGAKFAALNGMQDVLGHSNVFISLDSEVTELIKAGNVIQQVQFRRDGATHKATGDIVVLGANAIHSPFIMLRSGLGGEFVGTHLGEEMAAGVEVFLDGIDCFDGGTSLPSFNISMLTNTSKMAGGGATFFFGNNPNLYGLRPEPSKWRQVLPVIIGVKDILKKENRVTDEDTDKPTVHFNGFSQYAHDGLREALDYLPTLLSPLPVEEIRFREIFPSASHILGTLRMGQTNNDSVVDRDLVHHDIRNLVIVGTSVFPTTGSAQPSLTAAALSLRAAEKLTG